MSARFMAAASMAFVSVGLMVAYVATGEAARAATDAAEPAASSTPAPAAAGNAALQSKGRDLFTNWGCVACHTFADADAHGDVGPALDGDARLTKEFVVGRVTNGQGAMPAFGGQMTEEEIADLSAYIATFKK